MIKLGNLDFNNKTPIFVGTDCKSKLSDILGKSNFMSFLLSYIL